VDQNRVRHPAPHEELEDAVRRRVLFELGIEVTDIELVRPDGRCPAVDASGVVENEVCPVYTARLAPGSTPELAPLGVAARWAALTTASARWAAGGRRCCLYSQH